MFCRKYVFKNSAKLIELSSKFTIDELEAIVKVILKVVVKNNELFYPKKIFDKKDILSLIKPQSATFLKKKLQCKCFPVSFAKFSKYIRKTFSRLHLFLPRTIVK